MDRILKIISRYGIIAVLILAFILRFFWLAKSPPSLNWDETALGYNAYLLLTTGRDEWGEKLPLFLRSFDDYKPAAYSYVTIPFIAALGLNETTVRLPSVIAGTLTVLLIYLLAYELFKNKAVALLSSVLASVEPWAIHFSRVAFEANLALTFYLAGVYFLIKSKLKGVSTYIGLFFLALSAYTYHAEKIIILPTILIFLLIYKANIKKVITTTLIFLLPLGLYQLLHPETFARLGSTFLLKYPLERYFSYFSPVNLFVRGTPEPTQHIPDFGAFFVIEFFFWAIGAYHLIRNFKVNKLLFLLILVSPLPAVISFNWFYPARVLPLFAFYSIVTAYGITKVKIRPLFWIAIAGFWLYLIFNLAANLLFYLPYMEHGNWQYGMKQMAQEVTKQQKNYSKIVIETKTAQPHIFMLFYGAGRDQEFRDVYWDKDKDLKSTLLVGPESSLPLEKVKSNPNINLVYDLKDYDGNLLYRLVGLK